MKTISIDQLRDILSTIKSATALSAITVTDARCKKTNNPFAVLGPIFKICQINGMTGVDHEAAVERQQEREGNEDPFYLMGQRNWGKRIGPALIQRGNDFYIPIQLNPRIHIRPIYLAPMIRKGKPHLTPVMPSTIAPFLPPDRTAEQALHQGVERAVVRRDYKLSSLATISLLGQKLRIR